MMDNLNRLEENEMQKPSACLVCETMLPDAVDGVLSEAEQRAFDKHVAGCMDCAEELAEAQRGAAWLHMLKGHTPEPSAFLLTKILAQTSGAESMISVAVPHMRGEAAHEWTAPPVATPNVVMMPAVLPEVLAPRTGGKLLQFRRKVTQMFTVENAYMPFQPRLAMTAAMAFFSVALTLNMTGVKLNSFRASNLTPSALRRTVADTSASASRSFHNMRVVYQVESRLEDMRTDGTEAERIHSAAPYSQPAAPAQDDTQKNKSTEQQQDQFKGHSALELPEFPVVRERITAEKGV